MPTFNGTALADILDGSATADVINGLDGGDIIRGLGGDDVINGGDEVGNFTPYGDGIDGGDGDDQIDGGAGNDVLMGGAGRDVIRGGSGFDTITGGGSSIQSSVAFASITGVPGQTRVYLNILVDPLADDLVTDELYGGGGDDYVYVGRNDVADGGEGFDFFLTSFSWMDRALTLDLGANPQAVLASLLNATLSNFEYFGITGTRFGDNINGSSEDDDIRGGDGNDRLQGGDGVDWLYGEAGDDLLTGGAGSDFLSGGLGVDFALYSGVRRQYSTSRTSVSGNGEGNDTLGMSIEGLTFTDGTLTFDASSASAQIMRLYSATLNRAPDQAGLEANVGGLARVGLQAMADTFVASAEFQARFGALSNQQFVEQLYVFSLGRTGDPGGISGWVGALNGGATRGQVVLGFSESLEHQNRTATTLNAGLWVPDAQAQIIARMYDATFDRLPDVGGLTAWTANLKAGMSLIDIATAFASAAEFQQRYGAVSNEQFVRQMYQFCLNREPDPGGLAGWVNALNTGTSRAQMLLNFSESAEHIALTAASWLGGIRFQGYVGAPVADDITVKGIDDAQVLPGDDVIELAYDPADLGLGILDKDADAFVLPATPEGGLQTTLEPADPFDGIDLATLRLSASNDSRMMLILPEGADVTPDFDLDSWVPPHRDGHWMM